MTFWRESGEMFQCFNPLINSLHCWRSLSDLSNHNSFHISQYLSKRYFRPTDVRAGLMSPRRMPPCIMFSPTTNISSSCQNAPLSKCAMLSILDSTSQLRCVPVHNLGIPVLPLLWQQTIIHSGEIKVY